MPDVINVAASLNALARPVVTRPQLLPWVPARGGGPPPGETIMWVKINGALQPVTGITKSN